MKINQESCSIKDSNFENQPVTLLQTEVEKEKIRIFLDNIGDNVGVQNKKQIDVYVVMKLRDSYFSYSKIKTESSKRRIANGLFGMFYRMILLKHTWIFRISWFRESQ